MMEPELMQQLRVDDPMEEPELNLDGLKISSIQVLLEPPASLGGDAEDEDDGFYSPLDHFQNLVKLSMSNSQCHNLEGFPNLPLLRSLLLADNNLSSGFNALAEADLQSLVRLDLRGNRISDVSVLRPLDALENLHYLSVADNEIANQENYRDAVFEVLPQLIAVDGLDRDGTELDIDDDEDLHSDEENYGEDHVEDEGEYQIDDGEIDDEDEYGEEAEQAPRRQVRRDDESEDLGSDDENDEDEDIESQGNSDSELEDQENRPMMGGKTTGGSSQLDDEEDDDELEEEDDEGTQQQQHQQIFDDDEDDDDDEEEEEEEEENDEDDEEENPGLAYLLTDDIQDENDEEFEPANEVEEESEIESSDDEDFGSRGAGAGTSAVASGPPTSSGNTNGHHPKRPRSPPLTEFDHGAAGGVDENATGFDVDGDADTTNGFGMAPFEGPATFDDEATHESKRQRT
ncbi:hypothetical protein BGX28_000202 [Mortierella sp. GBA30]|nr:hypothetical protein BGX28_000202 [Mortierella sp. GBA30]